MEFQANLVSALLFYAVAYVCISFQFRSGQKRSINGLILMLVIAVFSVKLGYDISTQAVSHYKTLETGRHSNTLDIRRNYKRLSKIYHPDKNFHSTEDMFQRVKDSYDILMDEEHRDMYNRFGSINFEFDPRKDELKLMTDVAVVYLYFGLTAYLMTLPLGARAARTWLTILGIVMLAVEVTFKLTETTLPAWMPDMLTEHELVFYMHSFFPLAVALLRMLAESLYVDVDQTALAVLKEVYLQQKATGALLQQLAALVESGIHTSETHLQNGAAEQQGQEQVAVIQSKLGELRDQLEQAGDNTTQLIEDLRQCATNPGSQYYFLVFIVLYGGIYYLQM